MRSKNLAASPPGSATAQAARARLMHAPEPGGRHRRMLRSGREASPPDAPLDPRPKTPTFLVFGRLVSGPSTLSRRRASSVRRRVCFVIVCCGGTHVCCGLPRRDQPRQTALGLFFALPRPELPGVMSGARVNARCPPLRYTPGRCSAGYFRGTTPGSGRSGPLTVAASPRDPARSPPIPARLAGLSRIVPRRRARRRVWEHPSASICSARAAEANERHPPIASFRNRSKPFETTPRHARTPGRASRVIEDARTDAPPPSSSTRSSHPAAPKGSPLTPSPLGIRPHPQAASAASLAGTREEMPPRSPGSPDGSA